LEGYSLYPTISNLYQISRWLEKKERRKEGKKERRKEGKKERKKERKESM
jgi:hypothetical protein